MDIITTPIIRIGYINIYFSNNRYFGGDVYWTYNEAERRGKNSGFYVKTIQIEWEE